MSSLRRSENYFRQMQRDVALAFGRGDLDAKEASKEIDREYDRHSSTAKDSVNRNAHEYRERFPRVFRGYQPPVEKRR